MSDLDFTKYVDVDDWRICLDCKVELMDDDMIHKAKVKLFDSGLMIYPGIEDKENGDPIEKYSEGHVFQGRVIEYPDGVKPAAYMN